jgi:hypothetical protein
MELPKYPRSLIKIPIKIDTICTGRNVANRIGWCHRSPASGNLKDIYYQKSGLD